MLADARRGFLKPGGKVIPGRLKLFVSAVESEESYKQANAWHAPGIPHKFHWIRHHGVYTKHVVDLQSGELLTNSSELGCIDLRVDNPEFFSWSAQLTVQRDGVLHGLAGWLNVNWRTKSG